MGPVRGTRGGVSCAARPRVEGADNAPNFMYSSVPSDAWQPSRWELHLPRLFVLNLCGRIKKNPGRGPLRRPGSAASTGGEASALERYWSCSCGLTRVLAGGLVAQECHQPGRV